MKRTALLAFGLLVVTLIVAACAAPAGSPAAPAAEEAPANVESAAEAAAAAAPDSVEAPPVDPAAGATEATPQSNATSAASASADEFRVFQIVPAQSSMQYFVEEEFFGQAVPFVTAIGRTSEINGDVGLNFAGNSVSIDSGKFEVDLSTLTSDRPRRDQAIRNRWLESARYPIATFAASEALSMPADADFGQDVAFQVAGDMTIRDVTNPMTWDMLARIDGDTLMGTATTFFYMRDYGFEPPDVAGILKVTDGVTVTVDFVAQEVQ